MINQPMAQWETAYEALTFDERRKIDDDAAAQATRYARLSAYLSRRMAGGKHADAVNAQNATARKVRQALGFTYKDDKVTF